MHDRKTVLTDLIGVHIGERLADRREALGLSQTQLACEAGVSPTRLEKYEAGDVRIPAARLFVFATILGVPLSFFFDEMPQDVASTLIARDQAPLQPQQEPEPDPRETLELVRAFSSIDHSRLRGKITGLVQGIAEANGGPRTDQE